jgi:hypothetical protein
MPGMKIDMKFAVDIGRLNGMGEGGGRVKDRIHKTHKDILSATSPFMDSHGCVNKFGSPKYLKDLRS